MARTVQFVGQISKQTKVANSLNKLVSVEAMEYEYVRDQAQGSRWFQLLPRHNCLCESIQGCMAFLPTNMTLDNG